MQQLAIIKGVGFGLRDSPNAKPTLWFGIEMLDGCACMTFQGNKIVEILKSSGCYEISELEGKGCIVDSEGPGSVVTFIKMFKK